MKTETEKEGCGWGSDCNKLSKVLDHRKKQKTDAHYQDRSADWETCMATSWEYQGKANELTVRKRANWLRGRKKAFWLIRRRRTIWGSRLEVSCVGDRLKMSQGMEKVLDG